MSLRRALIATLALAIAAPAESQVPHPRLGIPEPQAPAKRDSSDAKVHYALASRFITIAPSRFSTRIEDARQQLATIR